MPEHFIEITQHSRSTAYIRMSNATSKVAKCIRIEDLLKDYSGPMVNFDLDQNGQLIGIEIVVFGIEDPK